MSTLSVPETLAGLQIAPEDIVENQPFVDIGYTLTKWTAEQRQTLDELHHLGSELTVDYNQLLPIYVGYLRSIGFLQ